MTTSHIPTRGILEDKTIVRINNLYLAGALLWNGQPLMGGVAWPTHLLPPKGETSLYLGRTPNKRDSHI